MRSLTLATLAIFSTETPRVRSTRRASCASRIGRAPLVRRRDSASATSRARCAGRGRVRPPEDLIDPVPGDAEPTREFVPLLGRGSGRWRRWSSGARRDCARPLRAASCRPPETAEGGGIAHGRAHGARRAACVTGATTSGPVGRRPRSVAPCSQCKLPISGGLFPLLGRLQVSVGTGYRVVT